MNQLNQEATTCNSPHIAVCVCTYKRPVLLRRLLEKLEKEDAKAQFTFSVVVVDNDSSESARAVVKGFAETSWLQIVYCVEPKQNIALARNRAIANARGEYIAFIDDDEVPEAGWLRSLLSVCKEYGVAGVLGPVRPYFDQDPPAWVRKGNIFDRPRYQTGSQIGMWEARTGNVLFRRNILERTAEPFRSEFGTAGEDIDFFRRMMEAGHTFIWCDEASVFELVPAERWRVRYLVRKSFLRGSNFLKHPTDKWKNLAKSFVAVPLYGIALPVLFVSGKHRFIKYLIKLCDHTGRILTLLRLNPIKERARESDGFMIP